MPFRTAYAPRQVVNSVVVGAGRAAEAAAMWTPDLSGLNQSHPWVAEVLRRGGAPAEFGDRGEFPMTSWMITGNTSYVAAAESRMLAGFPAAANMTDRNITREYLITFGLMLYWMRDVMTPANKATLRTRLEEWVKLALDYITGSGGTNFNTRTKDSDEVVGHAYGIAIADVVLGTNYLAGSWEEPGVGVHPVMDMFTEISTIVNFCSDGIWVESGNYNQGTLFLLRQGTKARPALVPQATASWWATVAEAHEWMITPGWTDSIQWGDEEEPYDLTAYKRTPFMACLCDASGDPGNRVRALIHRISVPVAVNILSQGLARTLWFFDPTIAPPDPLPSAPTGYRYFPVAGLAIERGSNYLGYSHTQTDHPYDHAMWVAGNHRLWSGSGWGQNHAFAYAGATWDQVNGVHLQGLPAMNNHGPVSATDTTPGFTGVGQTSGIFAAGYPASFVTTCNRTVEYTSPGTMVTRTRFVGRKPPQSEIDLYGFFAQFMTGQPLLKVTQHAATTEPTAVAGGYTWTAENGQTATWTVTGAGDLVFSKVQNSTGIRTGTVHASQLSRWQCRAGTESTDCELVETFTLT